MSFWTKNQSVFLSQEIIALIRIYFGNGMNYLYCKRSSMLLSVIEENTLEASRNLTSAVFLFLTRLNEYERHSVRNAQQLGYVAGCRST